MNENTSKSAARSYSLLEALPEALYAPVATHGHGRLEQRVQGIHLLRRALLAGRLPSRQELEWPEPRLRDALLEALVTAGIAPNCQAQPTLTDAILSHFLERVTRCDELRENLVSQQLPGLEARELERLETDLILAIAEGKSDFSTVAQGSPTLSALTLARLRREAESAATEEAAAKVAGEFQDRWQTWAGYWAGIVPVLEDLGSLLGVGRAFPRRLLSSNRWLEPVFLSNVFDQLTSQGELLDTLREMQSTIRHRETAPVMARVFQLVRRSAEKAPDKEAIEETMEASTPPFGDELSQLLPVASLTKAHPRLRLLWHARRQAAPPIAGPHAATTQNAAVAMPAHPTLPGRGPAISLSSGRPTLSVDHAGRRPVEAVSANRRTFGAVPVVFSTAASIDAGDEPEQRQTHSRRPGKSARRVWRPKQAARQEWGPIVLCVCVKEQLFGREQRVIRALGLEALRVATAEDRACYLYTPNKSGDILEYAPTLTMDGFPSLLAFFSAQLRGGERPMEALNRVFSDLEENTWENADILIITDVEFNVPAREVQELQDAQVNLGLRLHAILLGRRAGRALMRLGTTPDRIHRFRDWHALEAGDSRF